MMEPFVYRPIAHIENAYDEKFGIPRQSGLIPISSTIVFEEEFRDPQALRGIDSFTHLWLIWEFSRARREGFSPTVRPPRLGGNQRLGVFATRSPFRPNPIGLSCVRLLKVEESKRGMVLVVEGADLMNGTPILDIKPYLPYADAPEGARGGFTDAIKMERLEVVMDPALEEELGEEAQAVKQVLSCDPRPRYQEDENRVYGMAFGGRNIRFRVCGQVCTVVGV